MSAGQPAGVAALAAAARRDLAASRPARHDARRMVYGRIWVGGQRLPLVLLRQIRDRLTGDDLSLFDPDLMGAQGWSAAGDECIGPASPPPPEADVFLETADALGGGQVAAPPPTAGGGPVEQIAASDAYLAWAASVRDYDYWTTCQQRRARVVGFFLMPEDPREFAPFVRRHAAVGGPRDVEALWSDAALDMDYGPALL